MSPEETVSAWHGRIMRQINTPPHPARSILILTLRKRNGQRVQSLKWNCLDLALELYFLLLWHRVHVFESFSPSFLQPITFFFSQSHISFSITLRLSLFIDRIFLLSFYGFGFSPFTVSRFFNLFYLNAAALKYREFSILCVRLRLFITCWNSAAKTTFAEISLNT